MFIENNMDNKSLNAKLHMKGRGQEGSWEKLSEKGSLQKCSWRWNLGVAGINSHKSQQRFLLSAVIVWL